MNQTLWPDTTRLDDRAELWIGGCAASALAAAHGTPLYIFDETTLRGRAAAYRSALARYYPGPAQAAYASKAYLCTALAQLFAEEGLDLDVVSGGELHVALAAGFPPERIHFHGNNKSPEELAQALAAGIGRIVVDNFHELDLLAELTDPEHTSAGAFRIPHSAFRIGEIPRSALAGPFPVE
jgi:diaminopimelate decarboxylase